MSSLEDSSVKIPALVYLAWIKIKSNGGLS